MERKTHNTADLSFAYNEVHWLLGLYAHLEANQGVYYNRLYFETSPIL